MINQIRTLIRPRTLGALLITALAVLPSMVTAQVAARKGNSAARWGLTEFYIGGSYIGGGETSLEGAPVDIKFDDDWGFNLGGGYHLNDNLFIGGEFLFADSRFTGTSTEDDSVLSQKMRQWGLTAGLEYNLLTGPLTPYISAGLGLTYLETDDPTSDPEYICRPGYWGWWCSWYYPVYSDWFFTYYAGAGLRWDYNNHSVLRLSYKSSWMSVSGVTSTPRQDMVSLTWGGKF